MLFPKRFNTPFRMSRLLTVQGGFVHVDMHFNFEKCYKFHKASICMESCMIGSVQLEFSLRLLSVRWLLFLEKNVRSQFSGKNAWHLQVQACYK